jgi:hypothetical protein
MCPRYETESPDDILPIGCSQYGGAHRHGDAAVYRWPDPRVLQPTRLIDWAAGADTSAEGSITVAEHPCVHRPSSRWPGIGYPGDSTPMGAHNRLCAHRQLGLVVSAEYLAGLNGVLER